MRVCNTQDSLPDQNLWRVGLASATLTTISASNDAVTLFLLHSPMKIEEACPHD